MPNRACCYSLSKVEDECLITLQNKIFTVFTGGPDKDIFVKTESVAEANICYESAHRAVVVSVQFTETLAPIGEGHEIASRNLF